MARAGVMTPLIVLLIVLLSLSEPALPSPITKISCPTVVAKATPCLDYARGKANQPSKGCCDGVKALKDLCKTKDDRQAACECINKVIGNLKIDIGRVLQLPQKCGVPIYLYGVNANIDCSKVP